MNKKLIIGLILIIVLVGGFSLYSSQDKIVSLNTNDDLPIPIVITSPGRMAEVNGYVLRIEGNEVTIANEVGAKEISEEEKVQRQKLTQEERQSLKAQEAANMTIENLTITIPVGVSISRGSGDASGTNVKAEISEIVKGGYLSIWKSGDVIEFVKIKGISQ